MKNKTAFWIAVILLAFAVLAVVIAAVGHFSADIPAVTDPPPQDITIGGDPQNVPDTPDTPDTPQNKKVKIYIDPGHGFGDPGTVYTLQDGSLLKEMDITLDLSKRVCERLEAAGFEVRISHLTNESKDNPDTSSATKMTLEYRYKDANTWGADLFLSIHVNSYPASPSVSGIRSFFAASKKTTFKTAAKQFCTLLNSSCVSHAGEAKTSVSSVDYTVLKYTNMLSALLEIGFITNLSDRENMQNPEWLDKMADGIAHAISEYTKNNPLHGF